MRKPELIASSLPVNYIRAIANRSSLECKSIVQKLHQSYKGNDAIRSVIAFQLYDPASITQPLLGR